MGILALANIPYQRWVRFIVPLLLKLYVIAIGALIFAVWSRLLGNRVALSGVVLIG